MPPDTQNQRVSTPGGRVSALVRTDAIIEGRYRLGPRLGRGGMADVHEAHDLRLDRHVAIKRYRTAAHGVGLRRFMAEAELLAKLSHPGLLTVFDVSFDGERPFLVLRLAPGGSLRDRLDTGSLSPDRVAEIGASVAQVLAYVHGEGIVHRDVKPSNVLFDEDGDCYLADFGIARALGSAHITDSKEFIGTAAYLAPEQVVDREVGPPADVYALGLVLLECLTGVPEYAGSDVEMALARLSRPPRVPATWGQEWRAVLSAMTATDPAERPSAAQCAELLRALETGQTLPMAVPGQRRSRLYAGMATAAAAAVAAFAFASGPTPLTGTPTADPTQVDQTIPAVQPTQRNQPSPVANTGQPAADRPAVEQPPVAAEPPPAQREAGNSGPGAKGKGGTDKGAGKGADKGKGAGKSGKGKSGKG
jgi:serine/threonine protein kinase